MLKDDKTTKILKKVRQIEFRTSKMVNDALTGAYRSVFKGQGIDFEQVREYCAGDDVRSINWNVTAKMRKPFIKEFREERELTMVILVDMSASGLFGSNEQSKRDLAAELASVLAFSATKNNDKAGLVLFTSQTEKFIRPHKGKQHILRLIREILYFEPTYKGTDITSVLKDLNRILSRKTIVFLISDFLEKDGSLPTSDDKSEFFKILDITNKRHDLICLRVKDERENILENVGIIRLEDSETKKTIELNTSSIYNRKKFEDQNKKQEALFESKLKRSSIGYLSFQTGKPYIQDIINFFKNRTKV